MIGFILALAASTAQPATAELGEIRMHLFYTYSGQLSDDVSPPRAFAGWNVVIGEGDALEPADDLLVVVEVRADGHQFVEGPLHVVARGRDDRLIAERRFDAALTSDNGSSFNPLWLTDVGCEGEIRVTATFAGRTSTETLELHCGE